MEGEPPSSEQVLGPGAAQTNPVGELPDDPITALPLLLSQRARCFADLSVLCLDSVDQIDSAVSAEDSVQLSEGMTASDAEITGRALEEPFEVSTSALVERLGDAAIVQFTTNGKPASVLMIRTEAGWRLREIYGGTTGGAEAT